MAQQGFVGPPAVYEGKYGFFRMHLPQRAGELDLGIITQGLGRVWELHNVAIKPYPIGQMGVAHLGCAIALKRAHGIRPDQVRSIRALVPKEAIPIMCEPLEFRRRPATGYAAQFSIPYAIACGLVCGRFSLAELEEPTLSDPEVLGLAAKVQHEVDPKSEYPKYYSGEVIVTTTDGRELRHREHVTHGAADNPVSAEQICTKFMENAERVMSRTRAEKLRDLILQIEELADARALARALSGSSY
jgi:2-methylcitrate dehydratase PrpD